MKLLAVPLLLMMPCATSAAQDPRQFRSGTEVVTVDVSVRNGNRPVLGLTAADFEVIDNGVRQSIELQAVDAVPVDVSLVFDRQYLSQAAMGRQYASDLQKILAQLRDGDRAQVITFAADVREIRAMGPSNGTGAIANALVPLPATNDLRTAAPLSRAALDLMHAPELNRWSLFDAVLFALARPPEIGRRHLVIVFCLGVDSSSVLAGSQAEPLAARADAILYVALWNRNTVARPEGIGEEYTHRALTAAAEATGGEIRTVDNAVKAFTAILREFRQRYILRYIVTGIPTAGWHGVVVTTPRFPKYSVQARRGYLGR
jgi:VWFA-related protein